MTTLSAVSLGIVVLLVAPVYLGIAAFMRRLYRVDARLRLREALRGQGITFPSPRTELALRARTRAIRRCILCPRHVRCDDALEAKDWPALRAICPNRLYFDDLLRQARCSG